MPEFDCDRKSRQKRRLKDRVAERHIFDLDLADQLAWKITGRRAGVLRPLARIIVDIFKAFEATLNGLHGARLIDERRDRVGKKIPISDWKATSPPSVSEPSMTRKSAHPENGGKGEPENKVGNMSRSAEETPNSCSPFSTLA